MNEDPTTYVKPGPHPDAPLVGLVDFARSLASDGGDALTAEYDRALVQLTASQIGLSDLYADHPMLVEHLILGHPIDE